MFKGSLRNYPIVLNTKVCEVYPTFRAQAFFAHIHNRYNHCSTGFTVSAIPAVASGTVVLVQHSQCYMLCMCSTVGVMATATSSSHELRHLFHPNSCCSLWGCEYPFKYHNKILDEPLYICYCGYDMTCVPAYDIQLLNPSV